MLMPGTLCGSRDAKPHELHRLQNQPCVKLNGDSCGPCRAMVSLETDYGDASSTFPPERPSSRAAGRARLPAKLENTIDTRAAGDSNYIGISVPLILNTVWSTPGFWKTFKCER
ncbi:hypothetical protein CVT25_008987 [Psilocybe cyanescens]|uniref:Uncharacterized protein n=1 Tax=Psilocybe cyanescens TaxID=93625 RepID=A0A409XN48_PSICY|nr:hypothetical protein CVT25_008987 [Psilocybe cyanescens]